MGGEISIIGSVKVKKLHSWQLSIAQALDLQLRLAPRVFKVDEIITPSFVAGVDLSVGKVPGLATAAIVVLSYPELKLVETKVAQGRLNFPYIPGLLSFREAPLYLAAGAKLNITPDLIMVDGQGIAHPRRIGIASHLGLFWDMPTIGCAKSLLCGSHEPVEVEAGNYTEIIDDGETIGVALRTKTGVKPVYVSIGNKVGLETAIHWVSNCCRGYRLPEPLRLAHLAAGGNLKYNTKGKTISNTV